MTDATDSLAWATVTPRRCRRHEWVYAFEDSGWLCRRCGRPKDVDVSRRAKNNRSRGNAIERDVAKQLGLTRVGMYGGPDDAGAAGEPFIVQVKSGKSFPERIYRWLKALPANAGQTPIVVITDAPGPGHRRRALVILTLEDWKALHG